MIFNYKIFKTRRIEQRYTTSYIAERLGVSRKTIYNWENGISSPGKNAIHKISLILSIPINELTDIKNINIENTNSKLSLLTENWFSIIEEGEQHKKEMENVFGFISKITEKLNNSNLIISGIFSSVPFPLYVKNTENVFILTNNAFLEYTKRNKFAANKTDYNYFSSTEAKKNLNEDFNILAGGKPIVNKESYIPGAGKNKIGLITKKPIFNNDGKIIGLICIIVDITKHRENERKRIFLEKIINSVDNYIGIVKKITINNKTTYKPVFINQHTLDRFYDINNEKNLSNYSYLWRKYGKVQRDLFIKNVSSASSFPISYTFLAKSPHTEFSSFFHESVYNPIENYYFIITNDITQIKKLKETTNFYNEAYALLYETIIWTGILNKNNITFSSISDNVYRVTGYEKKIIEEKPLSIKDIVPSEFQYLMSSWDSENKSALIFEHYLRRKDNKLIWCETRISKKKKDGKTVYYGITTELNKNEIMGNQKITNKFFVDKKTKEIAAKLKMANVDVNIISNSTGLTEEEINKL